MSFLLKSHARLNKYIKLCKGGIFNRRERLGGGCLSGGAKVRVCPTPGDVEFPRRTKNYGGGITAVA